MSNLSQLTLKILLASTMATAAVLAMDPAATPATKKSLWGRLFGSETSYGLTPLADPSVNSYCVRSAELGRAEALKAAALEAFAADDIERLKRLNACADHIMFGYVGCGMRTELLERHSGTPTAKIDATLRAEFAENEKRFADLLKTAEFRRCTAAEMERRPKSGPSCSI